MLLFIISCTLLFSDTHCQSSDLAFKASDENYKRELLANFGHSLFLKRGQAIPGNDRTRHRVHAIIAKWPFPSLQRHLQIGSLIVGVLPEDRSGRIDNQSPIIKNNMPYYNVQVQLGTQTYSTVFIPAGVHLGVRQIRNAFVRSAQSGKPWIFVPPQRRGLPWIALPEVY